MGKTRSLARASAGPIGPSHHMEYFLFFFCFLETTFNGRTKKKWIWEIRNALMVIGIHTSQAFLDSIFNINLGETPLKFTSKFTSKSTTHSWSSCSLLMSNEIMLNLFDNLWPSITVNEEFHSRFCLRWPIFEYTVVIVKTETPKRRLRGFYSGWRK